MNQEKYYQQLATILPKMKRFQKAVLEFRREIDIPESGLPREQRAAWYQAHYLLGEPKRDINFSRESNQILLPRDPSFRSALKKLARHFHLDEIWYSSLFHFVMSDDATTLDVPYHQPYLEIRLNDARLPEKDVRIRSLKLTIGAETKLDDIRAMWKKIQEYQKKMLPHPSSRRKPLDNESVARYITIRDLEEKDVKQKDIADKVGFLSANDVAAFKRDIESRFKKNE